MGAMDIGILEAGRSPREAAPAGPVLLAVLVDLPNGGRQVDRPRGLEGPIVVDATNQVTALAPRPVIADFSDLIGSGHVALLLPGARAVTAFNTSSAARSRRIPVTRPATTAVRRRRVGGSLSGLHALRQPPAAAA